MNAATLLVTRRCGQACAFCSRVNAASIDPPLAELVLQLDRAAAGGARALTLTGGEPLLRDDLISLVRHGAAAGFTSITLETNATQLTPEQARALKAAGLTAARISLVTTSPELHAALVSTRSSPRHVFRGITAALDAGWDVTLRLPLARGLPPAAARVAGLRSALPRVLRFELAPIGAGERTVKPGSALSPAELGAELDEAARAAREHGAELVTSSEHPLIACVHPGSEPAVRRLFEHSLRHHEAQKNDASPACATCALATRCTVTAGQLELATGGVQVSPVPDATPFVRPGKSPGSRLHVKRAPDVETFFHVNYEYGVDVSEPTSRLGIIYRCNQVCTFCELADMNVELTKDKVHAAIVQSRARGSKRIIITGGEPTLSPHLAQYVAAAKQQGFEQIELQTNAVLLDKPGLALALREAGLTSAQVSLHGPDSALSDALTAAPGTHRRTLGGIDKLLAAGVRVLLNHLIFKDVAHLLVDFVAMAEARWGAHREQVTLQFHSPRNEFPTREEALQHVPRYSDYAGLLKQAIERGRAFGFRVHDLGDPTGIPSLCVHGGDTEHLGPLLGQPRLHRWEEGWLTRVPACATCDAAGVCMGVPKHYLALHGASEFAAIKLPVRAAR
ncbi:MAG: radical SAM protein [Archangium sp.]|nr:radical SAM protein [Archangium sp.]